MAGWKEAEGCYRCGALANARGRSQDRGERRSFSTLLDQPRKPGALIYFIFYGLLPYLLASGCGMHDIYIWGVIYGYARGAIGGIACWCGGH